LKPFGAITETLKAKIIAKIIVFFIFITS